MTALYRSEYNAVCIILLFFSPDSKNLKPVGEPLKVWWAKATSPVLCKLLFIEMCRFDIL